MFFIVANEDDLANSRDFCNSLQAVPDNGVTSDIEQWLKIALGTEHYYFCSIQLTLGTSSDKGLNRVPLEGPPTWTRIL